MKEILKVGLLIINRLSFMCVLLFGATGIVYELLGPGRYEKILAKLRINWSFERIWLFVFVCLIISLVTYLLRKKLSG